MKRLVIDGYALACRHHAEILHDILHSDPVEVVCLTAGQDSRKDLVLFSSRQDEDRVCRRFLKGLEEGVECRLREHVHLVDDVYAVLAYLRRYADLIHQGLDVLNSVIRRGIKLMDAV